MTEEEQRVQWDLICSLVADRMRVFTRPYVNILAGDVDLGTGTFLEKDGLHVITCEHVARLDPAAFYLDGNGSTKLQPGTWRLEPDASKDVAIAPVSDQEWRNVSKTARPLSVSRFAQRHAPVKDELLFFRGIAGENTKYVGHLGVDAIISGYCSQEKYNTGDGQIFEILWEPNKTKISLGTDSGIRDRVLYGNSAGFSGSLVWNTRFVELGCDLSRWSPEQAVVTGLLRRYDETTKTLLVWRIEHLNAWL